MDINSTINSTFMMFYCSRETHVGMVVFYVAMVLCIFVGTPAQSWLLWLLFRDGRKIKPTEVFPLNLIILELIYCTECAVDMLNVLIFRSEVFWRVIYLASSVSWTGRPLTQICICVEQYLAVLHPVLFLKYKGVQYRIVSAAVVWLIAAACAACEFFSDNLFADVIYIVSIIAVAVISFCCVSVLRALKLPRPGDTQITTERSRDVGNQQKRNAFNTIFTGLIIILFGYLPQVSLPLFNVIITDVILFFCNIVPIVSSFNILGAMITPLPKIRSS